MKTLKSFAALESVSNQILKGDDAAPKWLTTPREKKVEPQVSATIEKVEVIASQPAVTPVQPHQSQHEQQPQPKQQISYGKESDTIEFKTSFFFGNDVHTDTAQAYVILKEICAFLNNGGGVLYLGVNDEGVVTGVKDDIRYLEYFKSYEYTSKGRKFDYSGKDGYQRYIQDTIRKKIELVNRYSIDIKMHFDDNEVLVIEVPQGKRDVAILDNGNAYIRRCSESIVMSKEAIAELRAKRQREYRMSDAEKKANVLIEIVKQAKNRKKQIILHNYCSNNSATTSDRIVEAFAYSQDYTFISAYEVESQKTKTYKLCRVEDIEILNNDWQFASKHEHSRQDIFNMVQTEQEETTIQLALTLRAKNLLEEEYPLSKQYIEEGALGQWVLNTTVYNLKGVGRFCMGLLDDIQIISGDGLRNYISSCLQRNMYAYC